MILLSTMSRRSTLSLMKAAAGPAIALFVIADFAGFAILGPNGLTSLAGYRHAADDRRVTLARLEAERSRLVHHTALLTPGRVDPDYADELIRHDTGQVRPDEVILPRN